MSECCKSQCKYVFKRFGDEQPELNKEVILCLSRDFNPHIAKLIKPSINAPHKYKESYLTWQMGNSLSFERETSYDDLWIYPPYDGFVIVDNSDE